MATTNADVRVQVFGSFTGIEAAWRELESEGFAYAYQTWAWVTTWQERLGTRIGVVPCPVLIETSTGEPLMVLPLGVRRAGRLRILEWLGGSCLSDYHAPLMRELPASLRSHAAFGAMWRRVLRELPPYDAIHLERQPETVGPFANPFIFPGSTLHPSRAHATGMEGTLDEFLKAKRSASWRSKERRKERRLADHGEVRFILATSPEEIDRILPEMMRQKGRAYRDLGVTDLFTLPGYGEFVTDLTREHTADGFVYLCALEVGGRLESTYWGVVHGRRFYHLLPTYQIGELTRYAPGNVLLRRMFEWCLENDIEVFDFTSGDDEYKVPWCDRTLLLYDYFAGVTLRGKVHVAALGLGLGLKKQIKHSPVLLHFARRARARTGRWRR